MNDLADFVMTYIIVGLITPFVILLGWGLSNPSDLLELPKFLNKEKKAAMNPLKFFIGLFIWPIELYMIHIILKAYREADNLGIRTLDEYLKLKHPNLYRYKYPEFYKRDQEKIKKFDREKNRRRS